MLLYYVFNYLLIENFARGHVPVEQPAFGNLPTTIKTEENDTIFLPCLVEQLGENYIRWRKNVTLLYDFSKPVNSIPSRFTFLNDGMKIETVKVEDAGEYICEVVRPKPWSSLYLTHKVEVMYPPLIVTIPENGYLEVLLGQKIEIGCLVRGVPRPTISWRTENAAMKSIEDSIEKIEFVASTPLLSGLYQCEANNGIGDPVHRNIYLRVLHEPKVNAEKSWVHSAPGIKTALKCWVVSEPKSKVEWLLNGELFKSSPTRVMHQTNGDQHILSFNQVTTEDFGNYTCRASNNLGTAEDYIQLSGIANPAIFKASQEKPPDGFTLIWEVDSYSPVFEYKLLFRKEDDVQWVSFIIPADGFPSGPLLSKSYTLFGLDRDAYYEAKIFSRNRFGWSDSSEIIKFGFKSRQSIGKANAERILDASLPPSSAIQSSLSKILIILTMTTTTSMFILFRYIYKIS